jgi:hypothetical protein
MRIEARKSSPSYGAAPTSCLVSVSYLNARGRGYQSEQFFETIII